MSKAIIFIGKKGQTAVDAVAGRCEAVLANYGQSLLVRAEEDALTALAQEGFRIRQLPDTAPARIGAFEVDTASAEVRSTSASPMAPSLPSGRTHQVVGLAGPMHPDWKSQLTRLGAVLIESIDEFHHLAEVAADKIDDLQALEFVESVTPYQAGLKINPGLLTNEVQATLSTPSALRLAETAPEAAPEQPGEPDLRTKLKQASRPSGVAGNLELLLFSGSDPVQVADAVRETGAQVVQATAEKLVVEAAPGLISALAGIPQVRQVNPFRRPYFHNNVATGIIDVDVLRNDHGLDGSGQIVAIGDTGLDTGNNDATMLDDFEGRIVNIRALGRPGDASDPNGHGTHVAGSVLGDGANSNDNVQGMAPAAQQSFLSIMDAGGGLGGLPANLGSGYFDLAQSDGAHMQTNSWGADVNGAYTVDSLNADTFAFNNREFLIIFSAGNDGPNRIGAPGTAKNVLTVGASETTRPLAPVVNFPPSPSFPSGATANFFDEEADDVNDVAGFSSLGPAQNTRRKPDVVAPGTWILSARSSVAVADTGPDGIPDTGDEDGAATHPEAVASGLPGGPYLGGGDQNTPALPAGSGAGAANDYMYMSGTSMATPITAGACALVRQYLVEQRGHTPSAALIKALMVNGSVDMGMGVPHNGQGWGRVDLDNILFPPGTRRVHFHDDLDNAVSTGDINTYSVHVSPGAGPLAVTLVWRDPAGAAMQNRLHLRVIEDATSATAQSDPIANIRNNVQKVIVNPAPAGNYTIEVEGVSVATGVPELAGTRQDYALVVSNATGFSCNPSDVVQVIDRSGSMGFFGYMEPAKERAKQMIDILQINDQAGVVSFASAASEDFPLTPINSQQDKNDARNVITPISSTGNTDLREALEQGLTTLGPDTGRPRAIVFLSDGHHTVATPDIDAAFLATVAAANVNVYTIGLGPDSDYAVLNQIASGTGTGSVYTVESEADVHKLHEIYYDILGGLGCGGVIHLNSADLLSQASLTETAFVDSTAREAHFAVSWDQTSAEIDLLLQSPSGTTYQQGSRDVFGFKGSTHQFFRVSRPEPGPWRMIVRHQGGAGVRVTVAALAESDVACEVRIDPRFLIHDQILLTFKASLGGKPLTGGKATASITYPTKSIQDLLRELRDQLEGIRIDPDRLKKDTGDPNRLRLGILAAKLQREGKDIFERKTVQLALTDDGQREDPKPNDGVYTGFFDPKQAGVAGNFEIKVSFEIEQPRLGRHRCVKLVPVYVPPLVDQKTAIGGIVNAALDPDIRPSANRSLISIFGSGFTSQTANAEIAGGGLPTKLADMEVQVGNTPAPLLFANSTQINAQTPDLPPGTYPVVVHGPNGSSNPEDLVISDFAPGIFVVTRVDFTLPNANNPVAPGEAMILWCTGLGPCSPAVAPGKIAPVAPLATTDARPEVSVGGVGAAVLSSVLSPGFAGLEQVAAVAPQISPGRHEVVLRIKGETSNPFGIFVK